MLPDALLETLRGLDHTSKLKVVQLLVNDLADEETEAEWEERVLTESLADALNPDGSINYDILHATSRAIDPEELNPESSVKREQR